jgi:hypothetical protein
MKRGASVSRESEVVESRLGGIPTRPGRRILPPLSGLLALLAILAVVQGIRFGFDWLNPFNHNPFGETTRDRSGPAVLKSVRDLSRYEAAEGEFQVVVDLDKEAHFLPSSLQGNRTLFVGNGTVDAYVDFSKLAGKDLTVSSDRKSASVVLPHAQLQPTSLDPSHSYVFATHTGLLDRLNQFVTGNSTNEKQLYVLAAQKIQTAARQSGLQNRADQNTRLMLENLLKGLGFTNVTVTTQ